MKLCSWLKYNIDRGNMSTQIISKDRIELLELYAELGELSAIDSELLAELKATSKMAGMAIKHQPKKSVNNADLPIVEPVKRIDPARGYTNPDQSRPNEKVNPIRSNSQISIKGRKATKQELVSTAIGEPKLTRHVIDVEIEKIAKMLVGVIPIEFKAEELQQQIADVKQALKDIPDEQLMWLKKAYIFSTKAPKQERNDLFQWLALLLVESKPRDEKLAYTIARCDWGKWYKGYKTQSDQLAWSEHKPVDICRRNSPYKWQDIEAPLEKENHEERT